MSFGSGAMTNSIGEIKNCDVLFIIGSNPTEAHPVIGIEMKKALKKGATFIVADPRKIWFARHANIHLQLNPGTDILLVSAMINVILAEGLEDKKFIEERTEGFAEIRELVKDITPESVAERVGVNAEDIRKSARIYATTEKAAIFYTLGITEHICGTDNVRTLANLALVTGHLGKPSAGVNPLRGQNNVQGACDMGSDPGKYPGYQPVGDKKNREKFEKAWNVKKLPEEPGIMLPKGFDLAIEGKMKAFYIMGQDPMMSEPDTDHIIKALKTAELVVVQDIFMTETAKLADVVLPGTTFAEKDGTFTNSERRVQRVRKAINPLGNTIPDWKIICELATKIGYEMDYPSPKEIWDEIASLAPNFAGINYGRIENVGLQWPCTDTEHPGTKFLHAGKFTRGLGKFHALPHREPAELPDSEYPLVLSTGRTLYHYNSATMTRRSEGIVQKSDESFIEVHKKDADNLGINDNEIIRIVTKRGNIKARAIVTTKPKEGITWMPFHFVEACANKLTIGAYDNITMTAEYKVCSVRLEKI